MSDWMMMAGIGVVFFAMLLVLRGMAKNPKQFNFSKRVFAGLAFGILFGAVLQVLFLEQHAQMLFKTLEWTNLVGQAYLGLLQMIIMPLIIVSISSAILNMKQDENLAGATGQIIGVLVATTAISAMIGIGISLVFNLQAPDVITSDMTNRGAVLEGMVDANNLGMAHQIRQMLPDNPFKDMAGIRKTSTLGVVIFVALFSLAARQIANKKEKSFSLIKDGVTALHDVVMRLLTIVLRLTPYGVFAMMTNLMATSSFEEMLKFVYFLGASYLGLLLIFLVHLLLISISGLNPATYVKKGWPVFLFAFTSRSSMGTIPLNVKAQTQSMGVSESSANLSASLGGSIGQNGCAGLYPAMLAIMIMISSGMDITIGTIIQLILVVAISSFGVAGVGGGATFAALIVLSIMNLPVALVGVLISVEPLIDMGRTAINVSGAMTSGLVSSRWQKTLNLERYNDPTASIQEE
ncbi:cation:dicarboxylate symporter family transporter [Entomospira culicis]|uniref:Cation:dicarboxylase symporter family transporter n=1 Tax=Entomospira culicis TaxID=2719989 RepID=A0A968KWB4_9SPIO|nr:cation:dicarboxylase symporter family transporter [Entomospira culicis]NIZ18792.1 cation:dicarboxylase symporter family transporter [Entomospira culicis]NIZ69007.1 cation:dicarboxylase symporter family transporter [Entomospira culicis]WDI37956.1 cation:dicarboxylase symporter family transporter [Entomospira culicis]WDI39581.1 cation:dicarboxylase symporter family transporter [Entomospira culicis]